ncbi:MAG: addiction module toxin RelE [Muribaculaceae bacterium]|nr:addiction module toxin RelE [Muribaculaceae bacterium]
MKFEVIPTPDFEKSLKALLKRHKSLKQDIAEFEKSLVSNPFQGDELSPGIRKIRMAISSKGRGKSGGARIITFTLLLDEEGGEVYLIDIYDKSDYSTVDVRRIKKLLEESGLI